MSQEPERELLERCRRGDESAFQELVSRYKDLVYAVISRTIRDRSNADDLAQEVFLRVYRGLPYFRGEARVSTWIYRIVVNVCAHDDARRGRERMPHDEPAAMPGTPDRQFSDLELRDRLDKAIARLPLNYRVLVAAHYLDGVQYDALAEALQIPLGTVKTHLYRAKQQLRRLLENELR
jgi:RNA polymerase sigma-70 factor, ECF subfamily